MYYLNTDTQAILFQEAVSGPYYADKSLFIKKINSLGLPCRSSEAA